MSQWSTEPLWLVNLREVEGVELVLWMPPDTETESVTETEIEIETETETADARHRDRDRI